MLQPFFDNATPMLALILFLAGVGALFVVLRLEVDPVNKVKLVVAAPGLCFAVALTLYSVELRPYSTSLLAAIVGYGFGIGAPLRDRVATPTS
jgi:hypothetical protein